MKFMRQVGDGEISLDSAKDAANTEAGAGTAASAWAREFSSIWNEPSSDSVKTASWEDEFGKKFGG